MTNAAGRKFYYPGGTLRSRVGIDVSDHNGVIDWQAVADDGIEFAFLRAGYRGYTEGGLFDDARFKENLAGVQAAGIPFGVYFFSSAVSTDEAREEALYALDRLGGAKPGYPVVFDQEKVSDAQGRANRLTGTQYTEHALAFCEEVASAGCQPMIYGNQHYLALLDLERLGTRPLWYAEYGVERPTSSFDFNIWQYAVGAPVAGIEGGADLNIQFLA